MKFFSENALRIGNTPLVRINNLSDSVGIFAKVESANPSFSIKCRAAYAMIEKAEREGILKDGVEIVEPTSGNTGIALAYIASIKGYKINIVMPETMSIERRKLIAFMGAELILTEGSKGMQGSIDEAFEMKKSDPDRFFIPDQFSNPANVMAHRLGTGREIWEDTEGNVDIVVAGIGTGATISGIAHHIKLDRGKNIACIGVEPAASPVISQYTKGHPLTPAPHKIQGIGAGFIPKNLDLSSLDEILSVSDDEAMEFAQALAKKEGILCGISSGAAMAAACRIASEPAYKDRCIVVILPDTGERYLSTSLFESV